MGAHDGLFQSQTKKLEDSGEWNGMLIEPNPDMFNRCVNNRKAENNIFVNKCLVPKDYKEDSVEFYTYNNQGAMGRLGDYFHNESKKGNKITVPAININDLLKEHNITVVDFFSIDTEGADIDILDSIDFNDGIDYKKLLIEIHHEREKNIEHILKTYSDMFDITIDKPNQVHATLIKK